VGVAVIDLELLERIAGQRRFEGRTLEIAKRLFIHGETPKALAMEYGILIQRVYAIRREVMQAAEALRLPPGWATVTVSGPKDLIKSIRQEVLAGGGKVDEG
jgi:hypothetical protein